MQAIYAHRPRDVLDGVLTAELERERELALDLIVRGARDADPAGLGQAFETRGDVHAVAIQPLALDDDIAQIDPDAKPHLPRGRQRGVARPERTLNLDGGLDGVHDAGEVGQDVVTRGVDDPSALTGDRGADDLAILRECADRCQLVLAHETAIAGHVGAEYGGQLALRWALVHGWEFYA